MDGYSVTEAASVLGVPEGRVWELLARGVIAGTPEGDSMRVFLKAEAGPIAPSTADTPRGGRRPTNGNGGSHDGGEASAFRELLTEFRNLTERYGQALLALGEARGEVAGLRSRVELLEARIDLRLPASSSPETAVAWSPAPFEAPEPMDEPIATPRQPKAPKPRTSKRAATRPKRAAATPRRKAASEGRAGVSRRIAAALARADDPTISELPGGREAAEAMAALQAEAAAPAEAAPPDAAPPEAPAPAEAAPAEAPAPADTAVAELEVAAATDAEPPPPEEREAEPVAAAESIADLAPESAAAEPPAESPAEPAPAAIEPEPDWFADGDFAWLDAAEMERGAEAGEVTRAAPTAEPITGPVPVEMAIPEAEAAQPVEEQTEPPAEADSERDDEPGWGATPATAASEAETEIQAAFDDVPAAPLQELPEAPDEPSEIQAAFDDVPDLPEPPQASASPEPPQASASPAVGEVQVAVIDDVAPVMAEDAAEWSPVTSEEPVPEVQSPPRPPIGSVFSEADLPMPPEAADMRSSPESVEDAGASELESASSLRPRSQAAETSATTPSGLQLTDEELAQLAADEGWDASEVDAIRTLIGRGGQPEPLGELPGSGELRDAMAALDAVPVEPRTIDTQLQAEDEEWWRQPIRPVEPAPQIPTRPGRQLLPERFDGRGPDGDWLRRRTGPAANAYRRIRRLFSG